MEVIEFKINTPLDYNHDRQIDQFDKKSNHMKDVYHFDTGLTSENYARATTKLEVGLPYRVKFIPIVSGDSSSEDCMSRCRKEPGFIGFVGAQGLTLVYELMPYKFPRGKSTLSLDEKEALWANTIDNQIPYVYRCLDGGVEFKTRTFKGNSNHDCYLVCFCDINA